MTRSSDEAFALDATVDDFRQLFNRSSQIPETLRASLRKNIRAAGQLAADASKREALRSPTRPGRHPRHRGLRESIAAGIKVSVITATGSPGVVIRSTGPLARAYDRPQGWRHPTFGRRDGAHDWATTYGRPYFRSVIDGYQPRVTQAVLASLQEAIASLGLQGEITAAAGMQGRLQLARAAVAQGRAAN